MNSEHPLMQITPTRIGSWGAWKHLWQETTHLEGLLSLLHCGYDVPIFSAGRDGHQGGLLQHADRVCFYLSVADGYGMDVLLTKEEMTHFFSEGEARKLQEARQQLARKAFAVLSNNFFKRDDKARDFQMELLLAPGVLERLLWFFRINSSRRVSNIHDWYEPKVHSVRLRQFVLYLSNMGWLQPWDDMNNQEEAAWRSSYVAARPKFVDLLIATGNGDQLLDDREIDDACWARLEELAMQEREIPELPGGQPVRRKPDGIAQAAAYGSNAAHLLLVLQAKKNEQQRVESIQAQASLTS